MSGPQASSLRPLQFLETLEGLPSTLLRQARGLELPLCDSPLDFGACFIHQLVHLFSNDPTMILIGIFLTLDHFMEVDITFFNLFVQN